MALMAWSALAQAWMAAAKRYADWVKRSPAAEPPFVEGAQRPAAPGSTAVLWLVAKIRVAARPVQPL